MPIAYHLHKLAEKLTGHRFTPGPGMTEAVYGQAVGWLHRNVSHILPDDGSYGIDHILEKARQVVRRKGVRILVIDPMNRLEQRLEPGQTEMDYITDTLNKLGRFATRNQCLVILVAHPRKVNRNEKDGTRRRVEMNDINGSANFANMSDFCCGANEEGYHYTGVNFGRDLPEPKVADLRNVVEGDASPDGKGMLRLQRGIEVGHVFYLGTKYSEALNATYLDENGQPKVLEMGCYGIGVTRLAGAAIEQSHDERGIIWPDSIAPFEVVICPMNYSKSEAVREAADRLYEELKAQGVDVILDDRDMRPGVMFADWELIGVPHRVVIGDRGLKNGEVEYANRRNLAEKVMVKTEEAVEFVTKQIKR